MSEQRGLLVAVDGSPAAEAAIRYVGTMLAGQPSVKVHLLRVVPPVQSQLREHGGAVPSSGLEAPGGTPQLERNDWTQEQIIQSRPIFEQAERILAEADLTTSVFEEECRLPTDSEQLSEICLNTAREAGCNTIVVGRESFSWLGEHWHQRLCHEIVQRGKGFAVWIVCT